ncbi:MAG: DNA polymerase Y family protein [Burkholderiales bacterium]|nr:DNA polymerase Y family protein [Burkholderiales bacterium]
MLWLCLNFPRLPIEVFLRAGKPTEPLVVTNGGNAPSVVDYDEHAAAAGIRNGMALSVAYALSPTLKVRTRNPETEHSCLEEIALWALQFTSRVSLQAPDSLLLEIGASLKLFGGLEALRKRINESAAQLGFDTLAAVAPTPRGAHWLACAGFGVSVEEHKALRHHLNRLSVSCLNADSDTFNSLSRMGIRSIGQLALLPRDAATRRFGQRLLDQLSRAFGDLPDPQPEFSPPSRFAAHLALPSPVSETEALLFGAHRLILQMAGYLSAGNAGVTRLRLALENEDKKTTDVIVALSVPSRDPKHLLNLLRERFLRTALPSRSEAMTLEALDIAQLSPRNFSFLPDAVHAREERATLVEKLRARLGNDAVHGLSLFPDARPEFAWHETEPGAAAQSGPPLLRPTWLLRRPRQLKLRNGCPWLDGALRILDGPERIETGWWDGCDAMRDYFVARNDSGATFWIYRERTAANNWFLHGIFS